MVFKTNGFWGRFGVEKAVFKICFQHSVAEMSADSDLDMGDLLILLDFVNRFSASPKPRAQGSSPCTPAIAKTPYFVGNTAFLCAFFVFVCRSFSNIYLHLFRRQIVGEKVGERAFFIFFDLHNKDIRARNFCYLLLLAIRVLRYTSTKLFFHNQAIHPQGTIHHFFHNSILSLKQD